MDGRLQSCRVSRISSFVARCGSAAVRNVRILADRLCSSVLLKYRYDVALLYLKQADYNLDIAVETYLNDEKWESEHPIEANVKGKEKKSVPRRRLGFSSSITGQL